MTVNLNQFEKPQWMTRSDIKPYIFVREENRCYQPGLLNEFAWFEGLDYLIKEPLKMSSANFGKSILELDRQAFDHAGMPTPSWVFYDCGVMPGIVCGFAAKTESVPEHVLKKIKATGDMEWTPLSLFMAIPTNKKGRWMAHNLASMNSMVKKEDRFRGLGFYTKAFGLWYANIEKLYGITQWDSPALKLHPNYGDFEIVTAYTPLHDYPQSITYRLETNTKDWVRILDKDAVTSNFLEKFDPVADVDPKDEGNLIALQEKIELQKGPFYLWGTELLNKKIGEILTLYRKKDT